MHIESCHLQYVIPVEWDTANNGSFEVLSVIQPFIRAKVVDKTTKPVLQGFVNETTDEEAVVVTDEAPAYLGMPRKHRVIKHSVKQFVDGMAHTNGIESFGAGLKRGYVGVYHQISSKHLTVTSSSLRADTIAGPLTPQTK